jgi:5-methyltetrahydrofolate--homocysteine methyltransferase
MGIFQELSEALQKGDAKKVAELTKHALNEKHDPTSILDDGLIAGMNVVGKKFKDHEIYLPDVLMAAKAMTAGMDLLKPFFVGERPKTLGKVVIGTIKGDIHDIGKNLVSIMLAGAGFEVIDLGNNVAPEQFVEVAEREKADVIGLSALLTTTMGTMKDVVDLARKRNLAPRVKIIVGGAPLSSKFASDIGADAYCYDAVSAVEYVKGSLGRI